ncbi:MAG: 5-methyltetrahydropteroyltriglutamate--homocysteine S-methyltransferase [Bradyrhizobiaceae bacterium]|nr:5-methyltetrahydropteroyltriglutamate--homocysteine S-methyltransferase [Bradyrhizobiaceae bacterium]
MSRTKPPFRADHVGSLLRPREIKIARAHRERCEISAEELTTIEDRAIERVITKQEAIGLKSATDGELRRSFWSRDFFRHLDNVETFSPPFVRRFQGQQPKTLAHRPTARLGSFSSHPMIDHFKFLKAHTKATPKMTIPAPSAFLAYRGRSVISEQIYPDLDDFYCDLGETYRKVINAFADAGCRYLQLDEVYMIVIVDPQQRKLFEEHGNDVDRLPYIYADMINTGISEIPEDMVITLHLCRGNFRSTYQGSGGYDAIADVLFNKINAHAYFMEYDTDRAGGFEPLRLVPKGKTVVLGLITSKTGILESKDEIKRRIEAATKYIDIDQLCLSPQCGFASTEEGNLLTEDEQWAKLELAVEIAEEVWGSV